MKKLWKSGVALVLVCALMFTQFNTVNVFANTSVQAEESETKEQITVSVLTMHFDNIDKNITLALSNELGLLFKTTGADSEKKMLKLSNLEFQVRKASHA